MEALKSVTVYVPVDVNKKLPIKDIEVPEKNFSINVIALNADGVSMEGFFNLSNKIFWTDDSYDTVTHWLEEKKEVFIHTKEEMVALLKTYDDYIALLDKALAQVSGVAYVHGWTWPDEMVQQGKEFRENISKIKSLIP